MGSTLLSTKKDLGVTKDSPYFDVNGRSVFFFADPPHLKKAERNNLFAHQVVHKITHEFCNWDLIRSAFIADTDEDEKYLPRIQKPAIFLQKPRDKMKVSYAARAISGSMVYAIKRMLKEGKIIDHHGQAPFLLKFLSTFDLLFDLFNSSNSDQKKSREPFQGNEDQLKILGDAKELLESIEIKTRLDSKLKIHAKRLKTKKGSEIATVPVSFIKCWLSNINAITMFFTYMQNQYSVESIPMRKINQDCLENFFGQVRSQNGSNLMPNAKQFASAFKKLYVNGIFKTSVNTNSEGDFPNLLSIMNSSPVVEEPEYVPDSETDTVVDMTPLFSPDEEFRNNLEIWMNSANEEVNVFLSGFFVKKLLRKHECDSCKPILISETPHPIILLKMQECGTTLISPSPNFAKYLKILFLCWQKYAPEYMLSKNLVKNVAEVLKHVPIEHFLSCECIPQDWFIRYFVTVRFHLLFKAWKDLIKNRKVKFLKVSNPLTDAQILELENEMEVEILEDENEVILEASEGTFQEYEEVENLYIIDDENFEED